MDCESAMQPQAQSKIQKKQKYMRLLNRSWSSGHCWTLSGPSPGYILMIKVVGRCIVIQGMYRFNLPAAASPVYTAVVRRLMGSTIFIASIT
ncbi:hypothetical protein AV530_017729 [Patagioenas fasciata monilis]|uniref:Uncharacterized protein n=1 Tax=Patagioenas fasciata monilis TaxID=372326 RepID=A0A1V4KV80_PATFA|nr:hypothetical protein AV530_017729 [Patagioenas fasciata monilis]